MPEHITNLLVDRGTYLSCCKSAAPLSTRLTTGFMYTHIMNFTNGFFKLLSIDI